MNKRQEQYHLAYMSMAHVWATMSHAKRRQVGCLIVKDKMIISDGYNGMPSGMNNICEDDDGINFPAVWCDEDD